VYINLTGNNNYRYLPVGFSSLEQLSSLVDKTFTLEFGESKYSVDTFFLDRFLEKQQQFIL